MSLRFSRERWPRKFLIPNLPHRVENGTIQIIRHRQEAAAPQDGTSLKHRRTQMERTPSRGPKRARRNAVQRTRSPHASRMQETNPRRRYSRSVRRYHLGMGKCPDLPRETATVIPNKVHVLRWNSRLEETPSTPLRETTNARKRPLKKKVSLYDMWRHAACATTSAEKQYFFTGHQYGEWTYQCGVVGLETKN